MSNTIINHIHSPEDVKKLNTAEIAQLSKEIRDVLVHTVSKTGGHLSSNLGVVELTLALHTVFNTPHDQIIWDVGHQCYVHKLLTGRLDRFDTLRTEGGISGFPKPSESIHDSFIVGHSSTAVSAANGFAKAKSLMGDDGYVIAVLGDGALTGGLAYEGLSNAGRSHDRLIVILNDNRMSISKNVGFVARHLATLRARPRYVKFKNRFQTIVKHIPVIGKPIANILMYAKSKLKNMMYRNSTLFEEMGFYYLGPLDGHNYSDLVKALETAKSIDRPVVVHVDTVKGMGYPYAQISPDIYHGVSGFDLESGVTPAASKSFSSVFGETMIQLAEEDGHICAITAAMKSGTGLSEFADHFPARCFDVGIAEEHAVTFCSGLAREGIIPVFAVYSTFLQRCYDQLLNDTSIINSHIVLAVDRAGVVPDDGETHQGIFDVPLLNSIPNVTIYAPATYKELQMNLKQALYDVSGIAVVRYPKGDEFPGLEAYQPQYKAYEYYPAGDQNVLLITYGRIYGNAVLAANELRQKGISFSLIKITRIKPLDDEILDIAMRYHSVLFFEEGSQNGGVAEFFGAQLMQSRYGGNYLIHAITPFIMTCKTGSGLRHAGLDIDSMKEAVERELNREQ